jgi:signal recognition particle receptor subunit beta
LTDSELNDPGPPTVLGPLPAVYKVVFVGPVGAGKTQAIHALSDIEVVSSTLNARRANTSAQLPAEMDYGLIALPSGDRVHLYSSAGLEQADFMCGVVTERSMGMVLLINGSAPDPLADLHASVTAFRPVIDQTRMAVAVTHLHSDDRVIRPAIAEALVALGLPPVVFSADARVRKDLVTVLKALIFSLTPVADEHAH